mmetsp:Transcript_140695/g.437611  ORF Transcript_140695/g.437611 Transcript_140695/m.437611 type:complete len:195 (-) Transcript_140695:86-670(-)|eukprot:CAMPEP_0204602046 /NCGR_PEP_ID=MMETSP0661-20131031/56420_1 /ASSEMBLY_ACC=CAM_ASM_000606 /TAXON_ID=109239 /ORGANISM="Alexandrium margalefi, Strain AMGDE01CS-322" /LENGTH=194 /DNA_ID=CAMNT_0051612975 /DNA_START=71 /DNA_END=655 /DNA_ORIENTATION=+
MAPGGVAPQPEDPHQIELIKQYAPSGIKTLRACIRCRLVMSKEQFLKFGCPSCKDVLSMQDDEGRVLACTSSNFQGFITSIRPGAFVSRFNGVDKRLPGCYALSVQGAIPDYILHESEFDMGSDIGGGGSVRGSEKRSRDGQAVSASQDTDDQEEDRPEENEEEVLKGLFSPPTSEDAGDKATEEPSEKRQKVE